MMEAGKVEGWKVEGRKMEKVRWKMGGGTN